MFDDRGQAYTLEGLVAAVLIASSVVIGLQAVDVAPWTSGTSDDTLDTLRTQGNDVLTAASERGELKRAVTCLEAGSGNPQRNAYLPGDANATDLGPMLAETFASRGYNYNVFLVYDDGPDTVQRPVYPQTPREVDAGVVTVSRRVALYDNTTVYEGSNCERADEDLAGRTAYVSDQHPNSKLYAVVEVRIEVW